MAKTANTKKTEAVLRLSTSHHSQSLGQALGLLDKLLGIAVDKQARLLGAASLLDPWRGMHLAQADVQRVLAQTGHQALVAEISAADLLADALRAIAPLKEMAKHLGLDTVDLATLLIVLAPDVDLRYERIYAYLQDDVTRKRPCIDMIASLLCADADERIALFRHFDCQAPLVRDGIIEWRGAPEAPMLARPLAVDVLWRNFLLGRDELDSRLVGFARLLPTNGEGLDQAYLDPPLREVLSNTARAAAAGDGDVRLILVGPHGSGKAALAVALAHDLGKRLLVLDLRDQHSAADVSAMIERAQRTSALMDVLLYVHGVAHLGQRDLQSLRALVEALAASRSWFVLSLNEPMTQLHTTALRAHHVAVGLPSAAMRLAIWKSALAKSEIVADPEDVERVATRFRMSAAQIDQAVADTSGLLSPMRSQCVTGEMLAGAARAKCGGELAQLAQRITPEATFDTLVVTLEADAQLREICMRVALRETVRRDWTRGSVHARNSGVTTLFAGPSGTGKTLAAEVIARELGFDLFRIDLSAIVSKYIGETEKNLDRVFTAAENANAVLFFDEADALFGKRSEVKDAHDRYANIEIAYLLQKMEQFDGLAILATNLKQNLDDAFARRLTFSVNFAFPEASERRRLWDALWPSLAPRAEDVDLDWFAQEYPLSGGNIRNTLLAAIHLAAGNGQVVSREHLLHATRCEYQKLGKNIPHPGPVAQRLAS